MTDQARQMVMALLADRAPGRTVCPSEVARALTVQGDWRDAMPLVHAAVDGLLADGAVALSWKGRPLDERSGPYRIRASEDRPEPRGTAAAAIGNGALSKQGRG